MTPQSESERLENIAKSSLYAFGVNSHSIRYSFTVFERHLRGSSILELGAAEGIMTALLSATGKSLTVVEGSSIFCKSLRERFPTATILNSLFETFDPTQVFDNVVLGHVLEHVEDPTDIVRRASKWLAPGGRIVAAVPNSRSLHRQAAVLLGLIPFEETLNEGDLHHGHRRVFNPETFRRCFLEAKLKIEMFGGYWLKPLSNAQVESSWTPALIQAYMRLGERYPDIAGEIYIVAGNGD